MVEAALFLVAGKHKREWGLGRAQLQDFKATVAARVRLLCRDVSQARRRAKKPTWVIKIFNTT
eukprot:7275643-Alexandrium_andersonii.AAC.1